MTIPNSRPSVPANQTKLTIIDQLAAQIENEENPVKTHQLAVQLRNLHIKATERTKSLMEPLLSCISKDSAEHSEPTVSIETAPITIPTVQIEPRVGKWVVNTLPTALPGGCTADPATSANIETQ